MSTTLELLIQQFSFKVNIGTKVKEYTKSSKQLLRKISALKYHKQQLITFTIDMIYARQQCFIELILKFFLEENNVLPASCQLLMSNFIHSFEGKAHYGFRTFHIFNKIPLKKPFYRLEVKTMILFQNMKSITVHKSQEQMSNVNCKILFVNSTLNIGKFCLSNSTGELFFLISTSQPIFEEKMTLRQLDALIEISSEAIRFHLPSLLFAMGVITPTDFQIIEFLAQQEKKAIRKPAPQLLIILKYLDLSALRALERTQVILPQKLAQKMLKNDLEYKKLGGSRAGISFAFSQVPIEIQNGESNIESFILNEICTDNVGMSPSTSIKQSLEAKDLTNNAELLMDFKTKFQEEKMKFSYNPIKNEIGNKDKDELPPDKCICADLTIQEITGDEKKMLEIPRLCTLSAIYGAFIFSRDDRPSVEVKRRTYLLHATFPEPDEHYMSKNARQVLRYFLQQNYCDAYNPNILPHYLNKHEASIEKGFYCEYNKHGNMENFVLTKKRTSLEFLLEVVKSIISAQAFFFKKHGMVHLEPFLYSVFVTRKLEVRLGYLNKIYILTQSKLEEVGLKEKSLSKYKAAVGYPSELLSSAREIFDDNSLLTEKAAVFAIATVAMTLIFGIKPLASKKEIEPLDLVKKKQSGTFVLGYMPADVSTKGSIEILGPLHSFLKAGLDPDPNSRPDLVEMGVFFSCCLKAHRLMYMN